MANVGADDSVAVDDDTSGTRGVQVFSAPSDAPRVRLRTDLISAGITSIGLALLILVAGDGSTFDDNTLEFVGTFPGWLLWMGQAGYVVGVVYAFGLLIGVGVVARDRLELLRDMVLAALLAVVGVLVLTRLIDDRWPEFPFFDLQQTRFTFPAFFITTSTALQAAASPWLTAPMRRIGWSFILVATAAAALGRVTTVSDALGGLLVGLIAAAFVRYLLGTSAGMPSTNRLREGLADLGVRIDRLTYYDDQPLAALVLSGTTGDGRDVFVYGLGRDAWSARRWSRLWRQAWYESDDAQFGSDRRQQIEHESLAMLLASKRGVAVPEVITVGMTRTGDALLVTELADHSLASTSADEVDDELLDAAWKLLGDLHEAGISHGSLDDIHVWVDASGGLQLMGFSDAVINPTADQVNQDVAAMLVLTTLGAGADRAIAAARRSRGDDALAAMLPVLQTAALNARLRSHVKQRKLKFADLRKQVAAALGVQVPPAEQLTRVTWKSAIMTAFIVLAAYTLIGGLAEVGFDTIAESLADARWNLVLLGLVLAAATNYTDATALVAVSPKPVPVGVTTIEQFAIGFVNIAIPSAAGRVATNARYFQKFGISPVTSTTTGAITGFLGFVAQAILVALTILVGAGSIDLSDLQGGGSVLRLLSMAVAIFVGALIVVWAVPTWRHWAWGKLQGPLSQIGDALRTLKEPRVALVALGSAIGTEVLYAAGFAMCVASVGGSITLGQAIFINVTVSLFAGLMPIPGGVGVSEAGMTAGLTAIGVDPGTAVSAVLIYRLVSYYLPPTWGYVSLRWLTTHDYL